jgi:GYF domain 2
MENPTGARATFRQGPEMSNRSWYYAAQGAQQGPISEAELRDLVARGGVSGETLVWTEGMAGWEKAGRIPGLMSDVGSRPPGFPPSPSNDITTGPAGIAPLSAKFELWPYFGQGVLFVIGQILVVPAPWTTVNLYRYVAERVRVPGRPNLTFTGQPLDIWYAFIGMAILGYLGLSDNTFVKLLSLVGQAFLGWMILRWGLTKLASNGRPLPVSFQGSPVVYFGWYLFMLVSAISIIGWAWVLTAWMRWICRNIAGTRREVVFTGSGLEVLWRSIVFAIGCAFLIPIPWVLRWYTEWFVSQFALVQRT